MTKIFPEKCHLFSVRSQKKSEGRVAAAAICLELTDDILYVAYWGDSDEDRNLSPTSLLAKFIFNFSKNKFKILDLGIATFCGKPNHGLIQFKESLGAQSDIKVELDKKLW